MNRMTRKCLKSKTTGNILQKHQKDKKAFLIYVKAFSSPPNGFVGIQDVALYIKAMTRALFDSLMNRKQVQLDKHVFM